MKHLFRSAIMLLACGAFVACSSEDVVDDTPQTFKSDKAYFAFTLKYTDGAGTRVVTNEYDEGDELEGKINTIDFFFYDADGNYAIHKNVSPTADPGGASVTGEIEWEKKTTVVLENLDGKTFPNYVTVLINLTTTQATFLENKTIEDANTIISNALAVADTDNVPFVTGQTHGVFKQKQITGSADIEAYQGFLMTSAATNMDSEIAWKNYAQPITADNFGEWDETKTPSTVTLPADITPVECYVERAASKVAVKVSNSLTKEDGASSYFKADGITEVPNVDIYKISLDDSDPLNHEGGDAANPLLEYYVAFTGWNITATAKKFQAFKQIRKGTGVTYDGADWIVGANAATRSKRTAWGEGTAYNLNGVTDNFASAEANVAASQALHYVNYNNLDATATGSTAVTISATNALYCNPNTNSVAVLEGNYTSRATSAMLGAVLLEKRADGKYQIATRYRLANDGLLYTEAAYLAKMLTYIGTDDLPYKTLDGGTTYQQADEDDFKTAGVINLTNLGDGYACLYINTTPSGTGNDGKWYKKTGATFVELTGTEALTYGNNKYLLGYGSGSHSKVEAYNNGMMYYTVPIEHNLDKTTNGGYTYRNGADYNAVAQEGDYGVVRNHSYLLSVNAIEHFGHGVFDPSKEIVPNDDSSKKYYLGASLKVLSWRNVTQDVPL